MPRKHVFAMFEELHLNRHFDGITQSLRNTAPKSKGMHLEIWRPLFDCTSRRDVIILTFRNVELFRRVGTMTMKEVHAFAEALLILTLQNTDADAIETEIPWTTLEKFRRLSVKMGLQTETLDQPWITYIINLDFV